MCGVTGFWRKDNKSKEEVLLESISKMTEVLSHRGPDDKGVWVCAENSLALGHARLSILDLSSRGHQPMESFCGRYVISYNGEIYNFKEIRSKLEGESVPFKTECDTEVILAAISKWGINVALKEFNGMFAFSLWDKKDKKLILARDRIGIKPLYYGVQKGTLYFSSELKSIRANKSFTPEIDKDVLTSFFRYNYVIEPFCIYKDLEKIKHGTYVVIDEKLESKEYRYWDALNYDSETLYTEEAPTLSKLEDLLIDSVSKRMVSDVPLGAFLSGGIDSSLVTSIMQSVSSTPVKTFTIGFHEEEYNEATSAKSVAEHLGTNHTELYVKPAAMQNVIPRLSDMYDEPFADSSQIPTFLISELTKKHVTVSLSGDGGDENFAGYNRYFWANRVWNKSKNMPQMMRKMMASVIRSISPSGWEKLSKKGAMFMPDIFKLRLFGDKAHKLADILDFENEDDLYRKIISIWLNPKSIALNSTEPDTLINKFQDTANKLNFSEKMMRLDLETYLPDDILTKVDRASMAVSLEARVPLLDHRIVEFARKTDTSLKIKNGKSKWLLRKILYKYVPEEMIDRPKMGFGVPIDSWLRGPLREWAEELLDKKHMESDGILNPKPIRKMWEEHLSGKRSWQHQLWGVLMFQAWKKRWM